MAVTGDWCGAGLALALALRARDQGFSPPASLLLMSAWTDLEATGASYDRNSDPFFTREVVQALGRAISPVPTRTTRTPRPPMPMCAGYLRPIYRSGPRKRCSRTADNSRLGCEKPVSTYGWRSSPTNCTRFRWPLAGRQQTIDAIERGGTWLRSTLVS